MRNIRDDLIDAAERLEDEAEIDRQMLLPMKLLGSAMGLILMSVGILNMIGYFDRPNGIASGIAIVTALCGVVGGWSTGEYLITRRRRRRSLDRAKRLRDLAKTGD